jgi:EAL domain-containing protein (putative c-di-GMP-specific phosphodiesterase class I)
VVAEDVEQEEQRRRLRALECDFAQGFLFSHPLTEGACVAMLDHNEFPWCRESGGVR